MRRTALFLALALATAGVPTAAIAQAAEPTAAERGTARRLMEAGKKAFKARSYQDAARYFEAAYVADGTLVIALFNRAFALRKLGDLKGAAPVYRAFLKQSPDDLDAVYGLAECERGLGNNDPARALYARYVAEEKRPKKQRYVARAVAFVASAKSTVDPAVASAAGDKAYRAGRYADAAERYREAFAADPMRTPALYRSALSLRKAERYEEAKQAYQRFLALVPNDPDATYGLAETARLMNDLVLAVRAYERYAEIEHRISERKFTERASKWAATLREQAKRAGVNVDQVQVAAAPSPAATKPEAPKAEAPKPAPPKPEPPKPAPAVVEAAEPESASPRLGALLRGLAEPEPAVKPEPKPAVKPAPKAEPKPAAKTEPKPAPRPADDAVPSPRLAALLGTPTPETPAPDVAPTPIVAPRFSSAPTAAVGGRRSVAWALVEHVPADRPEAALDAAARALALDPDSTRAHGVKIAALEALGRLKDAEAAREVARARSLEPEAVSIGGEAAISGRAQEAAATERREAEALLANGRAEAAEAAATRALALEPGDFASLITLGRARRVRDPRASIAIFQRALVVAPERAGPLFEVAQSFRAVGSRDEENHYLTLYLRKEGAPDREPALVERARRRIEDP